MPTETIDLVLAAVSFLLAVVREQDPKTQAEAWATFTALVHAAVVTDWLVRIGRWASGHSSSNR